MMSANTSTKKGGMSKKMKEVLKDAIEKLSAEYKFNKEDGENLLGLNEKKKKKGKPNVPLPWTGEVCEDWCKGVRPSHGLYSQCTNAPAKGEEYCKTCQKKDDMPTVENREEWMATNGKKAKHYSSFLKKKGISREEADREAARFGLTIPESEYEEKGSSRGRPRKTAATSDTDESEDETPKKRGRPRKESAELDMFAQLVAENAAEEAAAEKAAAEEAVVEEVTTSENFIPAGWPEEGSSSNETLVVTTEKDTKKAEKDAKKAERVAKKAEREAKKAEKEAAKEAKAKLKAEKEAAKEAKAKLKAEKEAAKASKAKLAEEKAKLAEERKAAREERRKKKEGKKKATNDKAEAVDEAVAEDEVVMEDEAERKKNMAEIFDETTEEDDGELNEEEYGEEVDVQKLDKSWKYKGVTYWFDKETNDVYNSGTGEHIGVWNGSDIEEVESDSEDEE